MTLHRFPHVPHPRHHVRPNLKNRSATVTANMTERWTRLPMTSFAAIAVCSTIPSTTHAQSITQALSFNGANGANPSGNVVPDGSGGFIGVTSTIQHGPVLNIGSIFDYSPSSAKITTLVDLATTSGSSPAIPVVPIGGENFIGATLSGGTSGFGEIYRYTFSTNAYTTLASFNGTNGHGGYGAMQSDGLGNLFGTTSSGGANNFGTLYEFTPSTNALTAMLSFTANTGGVSLTPDGSGGFLGTTKLDGTSGAGTIFSYVPSTNTWTTLLNLGGSLGSTPNYLTPFGSGTYLLTTRGGGAAGAGALFRYTVATNSLTLLTSFNSATGTSPGTVVSDGAGNFLGTAAGGGYYNEGTMFQYSPAVNALTTVVDFNGTIGAHPLSPPVADGTGKFVGITGQGGTSSDGVVYQYDPAAAPTPTPLPTPTPTPPPASTPEPATVALVVVSVPVWWALAGRRRSALCDSGGVRM